MRLAADDGARVPFAMVAALIVMLSVFSTAYLGGIQRQDASSRLMGAETYRQETVLRQAGEIMATEGYYIASKSVAIATQFLCNRSMLDTVFQENYSVYLKERFPYFDDPYSVEVRDFRASIFMEQQNLHELVPTTGTVRSNVTLKGENGTVSREPVQVLDTGSGKKFNETSALARYVIAGYGNCTVRNVISGAAMEAPLAFERRIDTPFPLMNSRMLALESQGDNNAMGMARTVKYVLTTMAQFRVLEGYGSGLDSAPGNTSRIITNDDVVLAVNLAVILETARLFRGYDENAVKNSELAGLLENYVNNGTIDPADIVALYSGLGGRQLPVDMMLAQALNAIADQFVLKYLDYLGITDIANKVYSTGQKISRWVEDAGRTLSQFIFGSGGEDRDGMRQVTDWLGKLMNSTSWPPDNITIPGILPGTGGNRTDLAVLDVQQPVAASFDYNATYRRMTSETQEPIYDYDMRLIGTRHLLALDDYNLTVTTKPSGSTAYPAGYMVDFPSASILRNHAAVHDLWTQFYNDHYAAGEDVVYDTIRDAVKNITLEMASIISMFISQTDLSLAGYADGRYAVNPGDRNSILMDMSRMVDDVMGETVDYLQGNSGALAAMISALTNSQTQLILRLMEFLSVNYDVLADKNRCMERGFGTLAGSMLGNSTMAVLPVGSSTAAYSVYNELGHARGFIDQEPVPFNGTAYPDENTAPDAVIQQNSLVMQGHLQPYLDAAYAAMKEAECGWQYYGSPGNGLLIRELENVISSQRDSTLERFIGPGQDELLGMGAGMVSQVLENIIWSGQVANTMYCPDILYSMDGERIPFDLYDGEYEQALASNTVRYESFRVSQSFGTMDLSISEPSGTHYTDAATFSSRPFETLWTVGIRGDVNIRVCSGSAPYLGSEMYEPAVMDRNISLDLRIPVTVYSGWDLAGVEYEGTASLTGDLGKVLDTIKNFLGWIWDTIAGPIDWIIDQIMKVVEFFQDIIGTLLGYASDIMNIITDITGYLVELAQDFLRNIAGWAFDGIVGWILEQMPDDVYFTFSLFGFDFNVTFAMKSALEAANSGMGASLMTVKTRGNILGAGFDVGIELCKLDDDTAQAVDIGYDLLLSSQVKMEDFTLNTNIDPFMATQDHIVECSGQGSGWGLELVVPEIEAYDSVKYSLQDIPGVGTALSNIPIPPLGLKASINAGLEIVYNLQGIMEDNVVINEVELNPRGLTAGNQWVEILNPTGGPVNVGDWILTSPADNITYEFPPGTTMDPGGYYITEFENHSLSQSDNILRLIDSAGNIIDQTPMISEPDSGMAGSIYVGPMGSANSWQRSPDGANLTLAGQWVFNRSTKGMENVAVDLDFRMIVWNLIKGAFNTTWQNLKDQLELSLDFIVDLVIQFIQRFIEDVLRVVEQSVIETTLFLDIQLTDMTGSAGGGLTLSFVIEGGDTLASILRWIIGSVGTFLANIGSPSQPAEYPRLSPEVPEHLFIRLDFYAMVQVPQMLKKAVQKEQEMAPVKLVGRIEANIPALGALVGKEMGRWRINFGVYVEEMPADIADPLFGTGDANPDVWLFKGTVYEI